MRNHRKHYQAMIQVGLLLIWLLTAPAYPAKDQAQSGAVSRGELILAMNTLRVSHGLPALIVDPIVNAVAQATAETMAANNMSWHIGDVRGRIAAAGYGGGATVWATENFAVGHMSIDEIMQVWADPDHMRPAVIPAYCHVGAGVAQAADGRYYYILQAAYTSDQACGEYKSVPGDDRGSGANSNPPVSQIITPVKIATPDADGRIYHVVRAGQSFWSIAIAYQITIRDLEVWNNLSRDDGLLVGQKLFIPSSGTEGYATPTPVWNVQLAAPDADGKIVHEVQPYQALILIAEAYKVKVDAILALNGLQADWPLQIGQKLLIDPGNVTPSPTPRPLSPVERLTPASDGNYYHNVQSGEYLAWIADLYEVNLAELMAWNGLTSASIIQPGQQLLLRVTPPATATLTPAPPSATATITKTPLSTTSTQELTTALPSVIATADAEAQPSLPGMGAALMVVVLVAGLLLLVWVARRSQSSNNSRI
jgi:LysM repeat protein